MWLFDLDVPDRRLEILSATLSAEERERADAYWFTRDRVRFTASHGLLRGLLASYLGIAPAAVTYRVGSQGKPALHPRHGGWLRFNLSHSGGLGACAVASGQEIGVDVECMRRDRDHAALAERWFSPAERAAIMAVAPALRLRVFYNCWTRKEAYLKARGDGLLVPLDSFDVSVRPNEPAALLRSAAGVEEPDRWRLLGFTPVPGFAGALAVEARGWTATVRRRLPRTATRMTPRAFRSRWAGGQPR